MPKISQSASLSNYFLYFSSIILALCYNYLMSTTRKKPATAIAKIITFILVFVLIFSLANSITFRKESYLKNGDFFAETSAGKNYDVLFFGSSHMLNAVYPMELWNEYGIVSYNLANHAERTVSSYYNMRLALQYDSPKLVVIDAFMSSFWGGIDYSPESNGKANLHNTLDQYPPSPLKAEAIQNIFGSDLNLDVFVEYMFPFSIYHSRWEKLDKTDFNPYFRPTKGAEVLSSTKQITLPNTKNVAAYSGEEIPNMTYLRKFIEHAKNNNIEVLVINLPYSADESLIAKSKYYQKICDDYNVNYINFLEDKNQILNANTDFANSGHLNTYGAKKLTHFLGEYVKKHYDIPNKKDNTIYSSWNDDYNKYKGIK